MDCPKDDDSEETTNEYFLIRELQKYLQLYTEQNEDQTYLFYSLIACSDELFIQLRNLLDITKRIKSSLQISKLSTQSQPMFPEFVVKQIKKVRRTREENAESVANKLKVIVSKTMQKESSSLKHNYSSYVALLLEQMSEEIQTEPIKKMREEFRKIREMFNVVSLPISRHYRHHPSSFIQYGIPTDFYVSFYCERLLFFQDIPLPFNGNLLFVPIMLSRVQNRETSKITHTVIQNQYINELYRENGNWENFTFEIIFKDNHKQTIAYYFCASHQKKSASQIQTCAMLRKIRLFVYFSMIYNYLNHVLIQADLTLHKKSLHLPITEDITLQLTIQHQNTQQNIQSNPIIMQDFLRYFSEESIRKRAEVSRKQATANFQHYLQCMLAKIKYKAKVSEQYVAMKPKYLYVGGKRVQV